MDFTMTIFSFYFVKILKILHGRFIAKTDMLVTLGVPPDIADCHRGVKAHGIATGSIPVP